MITAIRTLPMFDYKAIRDDMQPTPSAALHRFNLRNRPLKFSRPTPIFSAPIFFAPLILDPHCTAPLSVPNRLLSQTGWEHTICPNFVV
jgi:hypothetical protein